MARAGNGIRVDLDRVHTREEGMTAPELLMSESQERMLAFVHPDQVEAVLEVARRWETEASIVGEVVAGDQALISFGGELVAEVPVKALATEAPKYHRPLGEPGWMEDLWSNTVHFVAPPDLAGSLLRLLSEPELGSKAWAYQQYDHMLFLNTLIGPGQGATLLRLPGTERGLALSVDGDGRLCYLDPRRGGARLVWEAALNIACIGAEPMALVDNLNFGNPEKPEVMWQFREVVEGISEACEALGIPVIGGNVSFYNETDGLDIYPTPVVGIIGLIEELAFPPPRLDRATEGSDIYLLGTDWAINLAGSAFEKVTFGHVGGRPSAPDPTMGRAAIQAARSLADRRVGVIQDISSGGLAVALAEICIASGIGASVEYQDWRHIWSEDPHRFLAVGDGALIETIAVEAGVPCRRIGQIGGETIVFRSGGTTSSVDLDQARMAWKTALSSRLQGG